MSNKIGFRTIGFRNWDLAQALQRLADIGFDGVELCLEHPQMRPEILDTANCMYWVEKIQAAGLQVASVSYHGDGEEYHTRAANQVQAVEIAANCGAQVLILNGEKAIEGSEDEQWQNFVTHLREQIMPRATEHGLLVGLEPEPGHYLNSSTDLIRLLAEVSHPALGANLDIGHAWLTDPDLAQSIHDMKPYLWHLHWEDFPSGEHRHLVPGTGDIPLTELYDLLQAISYTGYYTVDLFNIADDPETPARESLTAVQTMFGSGG